jgi:predicted glycoside hydrolase/deacetylase ChbG (UPF0249 family)
MCRQEADMVRMILRADDLGYSKGVNCAIASCLKAGTLKTAGLMVNMEARHAWNLIKGMDICLGLHANISAGRPISNPEDVPSLVNGDGMFKSSKQYNQGDDIAAYEDCRREVQAQIQAFQQLTGRMPDYVDPHAVASQNFGQALADVCAEYGLDFYPFTMEDPILKDGLSIYVHAGFMLKDYNPARYVKDLVSSLDEDEQQVHVVVFHPGWIDGYLASHSSLIAPRILEADFLEAEGTERWFEKEHVDLVTFRDI